MKAPGGIPLPGSGTLALAARWAGTTDDPILGAAPWIVLDLLHGLEAADGGDSRFSDEFLEEWRTRLRPRLVAFWKHIPAEDRFLVELDGDPGEEWLVVARDLGATGFVHDFRFLAILDPGSGKDFGGLLAYERLDENEQIIEVGLADLDGDGTQEILVRTIVPAGWCWSGLHVIGTTASHRRHVASSAGWQAILSCDGSPPFMIATASPFQPLPGGKATYLSGVVALTCDLASWAPEGLRPLGSILLPR